VTEKYRNPSVYEFPLIRDAQINTCFSIYEPILANTSSFLSQTDRCFRRLFSGSNGKLIFVLRVFALREVWDDRLKLANRGIPGNWNNEIPQWTVYDDNLPIAYCYTIYRCSALCIKCVESEIRTVTQGFQTEKYMYSWNYVYIKCRLPRKIRTGRNCWKNILTPQMFACRSLGTWTDD
jgi:hypothetical protein